MGNGKTNFLPQPRSATHLHKEGGSTAHCPSFGDTPSCSHTLWARSHLSTHRRAQLPCYRKFLPSSLWIICFFLGWRLLEKTGLLHIPWFVFLFSVDIFNDENYQIQCQQDHFYFSCFQWQKRTLINMSVISLIRTLIENVVCKILSDTKQK